jgi:hypothetical protein
MLREAEVFLAQGMKVGEICRWRYPSRAIIVSAGSTAD